MTISSPMMRNGLMFLMLAVFAISCKSVVEETPGVEIAQWRGDNRDGVYAETGLLKQWPDSLPLLWEFEGLGNGYAAPVVTRKDIYILGELDSVCYLFAIDKKGNELWRREVGPEWTGSFPGSRSTPTFYNDTLYVSTGMGIVGCFDAKTGNKIWLLNMVSIMGGRNNRFGFSESLLVDSEKLYCMPGGIDTNVVALNKRTGEVVWVCKAESEIPAYTSPLLVNFENRNLLFTFSKKYLLAIDADSGEMLWSHEQEGRSEGSLHDVHCNTPVYENGYLYYVSGDGNGAVKLKITNDGAAFTELWRNLAFDDLNGGFIKIGNYMYASGFSRKRWHVLDTENGEITDTLRYAQGVTIYADSLLYLYNDRGMLALAKPKGPTIEIISEQRITRGTKEHFSHPVINDGILYLRRGNSLMAFDIRKL